MLIVHHHHPVSSGPPADTALYAKWEPRVAKLVKLAEANFFDAADVPDLVVVLHDWLKQAQEPHGEEARQTLANEAAALLCSLQQRLKQQAADEARMETESPSVPEEPIDLKSTRLYEAANMLCGLHEDLVGLRPEALPSEAGTPRKS